MKQSVNQMRWNREQTNSDLAKDSYSSVYIKIIYYVNYRLGSRIRVNIELPSI